VRGASALALALASNRSLERLVLQRREAGEAGITALVDMLSARMRHTGAAVATTLLGACLTGAWWSQL